jgi:hypothetical protein
MTEIFGPCGYGWGYEDDNWQVLGNYIFCRVNLWYRPHFLEPSIPFEIFSWVREQGGTEIAKGRDEARKQTVTDGLSRCFMALGLGAAIYAGFKDNKYTSEDEKGESAAGKSQNDAGKTSVPSSPSTPPAGPVPSDSLNGNFEDDAKRDELLNKFVYSLIEADPILASCNVRSKGNSVFFAVEKGSEDDGVYVSKGFVTPSKHPHLLCKRFDIPTHQEGDRLQ